jgi:acetolactate synthase-1/2/3 large subunit
VVLADEPTGNLDSAAARGVLELLGEARRRSQTVLLVTHDARVAAAADRVIRMRDSRIVADGRLEPARFAAWASYLASLHEEKSAEQERRMSSEATPIHPLRLCKEVRDFLPRDAVLCVDGQEILTYARQSIPFYAPHSLNSGPWGCMGVGLPFGIGAKIAVPDKLVVVLHGDGSFGLNALEMDTALRHQVPLVCVVSNNGGWTARDRYKAGRELGFTRYDRMMAALGCHAEHVEDPNEVRPALERAVAAQKPALINVVTDPMARAQQVKFANYST